MAGANGCRSALIDLRDQRDVALFEIVFGNSLHLFQDVADFEVGSGLREGALRDVINLLEVEDAVEDALGFVEGFVGDQLTLGVQMVVKLLQVDQRNL